MTDRNNDTTTGDWAAFDLDQEGQIALRERRFADVLDLTADAEDPGAMPRPAALGQRAIALAGLGHRDQAYALLDRLSRVTGGDRRAWVAKRMAARLLGDLPVLVEMLFTDLEARYSMTDCQQLARNLMRMAQSEGKPAPGPRAVIDRLCRQGATVARLRAAAQVMSEMGHPVEAAKVYADMLGRHGAEVGPDELVEASSLFVEAGQREQAHRLSMEAIRRAPIVRRPVEGASARLLVISDLLRRYFHNRPPVPAVSAYGGNNYAVQMEFRQIEVGYGIFNSETFDAAARDFAPDAILGNFSFAAGRPDDFLDQIDAAFDRLGAVVFNHPRHALRLTRHGNYQRLAGRSDISMARTELITVDGADIDGQIAWIEQRFTYPVIARPPATQFGGGAECLDNRAALAGRLTSEAGKPLYIIQFLELRRDWADRPIAYRAVMIDGALYPVALFTGRDWTTHIPGGAGVYRETVLAHEDRFQQAMRDYMLDFETTIPADHRQALLSALHETGMDIVGADFGCTKDGRPVIFEMNANMMYQMGGLMGPQFPYFVDTDARIRQAIEAMFLARIGAA